MKTEKLHFKKVTGLILLLLLFIAGVGNSVFAQATVQTDKADYLPGELVIITGAGWMADETITLNIEHLVFTAHPAETWTTTASSPGLLFDASYIIDPWDLGETFLLTATGQTSGYVATTTFTDGDFLGTIEIGIQQGYFLQGEPGSVIFPILVTRSDDAGNGNFDVRVCITENFPDYFTYTFDSPGYLPDQGIIHFNTGQDEAEGTMTVIYDGATANPNDVWTFSIMGYVLPNNQNTNYNCSNPTNDNATGTFEGTLAFGLPPAITCPAPIVANTDAGLCSAIVSYEPIVIGDPAPVITYSMSGATNGTGSGTGSGIAFAKGTTTVTLTASNGIPPDATCSFAVTVEDHQAPSFTAPANTTIYTDGACLYNATVSVTGDVTNESDNCPGVLDATFSDVVADGTCQGSKVITRTWSLVDASGNAATTQDQIITVLDNIDPTFTAPANIEIFTDADCAYDASTAFTGDVIDEDDNCTTTLNATYSDVTVNGPCEGSHIITRTWSLVDDCGNAADDQIQIITVSDNIDPTFTAPANIEIFTDADCAYDASTAFTGDVIDEDDNCTTILEATFADAIIDGPCEGSHVITRTWSLVDDCGNAALDQVQVITVSDNTAPTFTVPADVEIFTDADCDFDASVNATGDVTDEDDNCTTILEATFADAIIDGPCEGSHVITRTWSLVDDCGNAALDQVQVITVSDNTAPTFTVPADIEIFTDADCDFDASVTATGDVTNEDDNCTTSLNATYSDVTENGPCEGSHIITRTWSLVDDCGNAAPDQDQIITVSDNIVPTFTAPDDIEIFTDENCAYDASPAETGDVTDEDDNCSTGLQAAYADVTANGPCEGSKIITRTWSLVDHCGNAAIPQVQIITVSDNIAPTFTAPADITIYTDENCEYDASPAETGDVTDEADNCSTGLEATYIDSDPLVGNCDLGYYLQITRTWSLVDNCGNAAEDQIQIITVLIPTTMEVFTSAVQARYYDNMTLYAEIANNCEDAGLTGIVEFFIDGNSVGTANAYPIPAGEEGYLENKLRATLLHQLVEMPGTYEVTALFTPDCGIYTISNGAAESDIIVLAREASPLAGSAGFYTGPLYSWTTGPNSSTATITMTAVIKDNNIPTGDVRGAIVTFYHIDNGVLSPIPSAQNLPVNLIDMTDGTVGAASAIVQFNIGNWNALDFEIAVGISGGYTNNPLDPESRATVTVSKPVQGGYIVGGGQIANTTSTNGLIKGALGDTYNTDYSFNVKYNKKGTNPQGAASITIFSWYDANGLLDDDIHIYHVKSNAIATLAVNKPGDPNAYFSAKATLKEELEGGVMVSIEGNNTLQLWMTDPGNDGIATGISTLGIQLNRKAGGIWFSSYWTGTTTTEQPIFAGSELMVAPASAVRSSEITVDPITEEVNAGELTVYPNPTNSNATFRFIPQTDSKATLEIFNMNGSAVQVLYEGNVIAGQTYEIKYQPGNRQAGMLLYRLILDEKVLNGKLMIQH